MSQPRRRVWLTVNAIEAGIQELPDPWKVERGEANEALPVGTC